MGFAAILLFQIAGHAARNMNTEKYNDEYFSNEEFVDDYDGNFSDYVSQEPEGDAARNMNTEEFNDELFLNEGSNARGCTNKTTVKTGSAHTRHNAGKCHLSQRGDLENKEEKKDGVYSRLTSLINHNFITNIFIVFFKKNVFQN